jgi:glycosyltransferase involved in cell wall biosynthesis
MLTTSIIVPCYNAADFLSATIESVLRQELPDWELVLVDDGSSDSTWEIICRYMQADSRIAGFRKPNEGTTRTRNYGFSKTSDASPYILFLDHDDQLEPNALARMCAYMQAHPGVGLLACQFEDVSADGRRLGTGGRSRWAPGFIFPHQLRDDEVETAFATFFCATGAGPFAMYRRSVYVQTEGWDTSFWPHEDTDMFCQMALLASVHCLPDRLYLKRIHPAQGMSDEARVQRSYAAFRAKWDNRPGRNARETALLKHARKYYYAMHRPCRDLKVSQKALVEFLAHPNLQRLGWCVQLLASALQGFMIQRFKA